MMRRVLSYLWNIAAVLLMLGSLCYLLLAILMNG